MRRHALLLCALPALSCAGAIEGEEGGGQPPDGPSIPGPGAPASPTGAGGGAAAPTAGPLRPGDPQAAGPRPLRGLSREEYTNTLRDLVGSAPTLEGFTAEGSAAGFATLGPLSDVAIGQLEQAAQQVAGRVTLKPLLPCTLPTKDEPGCAEAFIKAFGRRAFRRPLAPEEIAEYKAFYTNTLRGALGLTFEEAARGLIEAMLVSPFFLYHWELGAGPAAAQGGVVKLNPHEVASRLSYFLWRSMPDAELFAAADAAALGTAAEVEAHARRMLKDPRARQTLKSFLFPWLLVDGLGSAAKDKALYPAFSSAVGQAMEEELLAFAQAVLLDGDGSMNALLTAPFGFANKALAAVYGLKDVTATSLARVDLDPAQRPGLLTRAGFLAMTANAYEGDPTKRGVVVREQLLCQEIPPPPMNVPPLPPPSPDATVRERHAVHMDNPACKGCHELTDHIGFGLGNFDAIGAFHATEKGKPVDASGKLVNADGQTRAFKDLRGLVDALSASDELKSCVVRQWLRFGWRRTEHPGDAQSLHASFEAFRASGWDVRELLVALARSRSFLYRAPATGEVTR